MKYTCRRRNSPLRFSANALGQQADMWFRYTMPKLARLNPFIHVDLGDIEHM